MDRDYTKSSYENRYHIYEREKRIIAQTAKDSSEYDRRIRNLIDKLKI